MRRNFIKMALEEEASVPENTEVVETPPTELSSTDEEPFSLMDETSTAEIDAIEKSIEEAGEVTEVMESIKEVLKNDAISPAASKLTSISMGYLNKRVGVKNLYPALESDSLDKHSALAIESISNSLNKIDSAVIKANKVKLNLALEAIDEDNYTRLIGTINNLKSKVNELKDKKIANEYIDTGNEKNNKDLFFDLAVHGRIVKDGDILKNKTMPIIRKFYNEYYKLSIDFLKELLAELKVAVGNKNYILPSDKIFAKYLQFNSLRSVITNAGYKTDSEYAKHGTTETLPGDQYYAQTYPIYENKTYPTDSAEDKKVQLMMRHVTVVQFLDDEPINSGQTNTRIVTLEIKDMVTILDQLSELLELSHKSYPQVNEIINLSGKCFSLVDKLKDRNHDSKAVYLFFLLSTGNAVDYYTANRKVFGRIYNAQATYVDYSIDQYK